MIEKSKRMGDLQKVDNKDRKFGSNSEYYYIRVQRENNDEVALLFTEHEIKVALDRAEKNTEDLPEVGKIRDFFD